MSRPCSQLNSKVIRDQAECHIIAEIEKTYSVVAFKCVWRVKDDEIQRAWNWICCEKRDDCDLTLSKLSEVCFLFSAISTSKLGRKNKKKQSIRWSRPERAATTQTKNLQILHQFSQFSSDFITRETNFTSNFILGGVPNSQWFRSKSIQDSTSPGEMWPRVLPFQSIKEKEFPPPQPALSGFERPSKSLFDEFCRDILSALSYMSDQPFLSFCLFINLWILLAAIYRLDNLGKTANYLVSQRSKHWTVNRCTFSRWVSSINTLLLKNYLTIFIDVKPKKSKE